MTGVNEGGSMGLGLAAQCCGGCGHSAEGEASQVTLLPELLVQDVSVLVEAAIDAPHLPCFAHPQLPADQPDQPLVMGHQHHPALPQGETYD